jgi:excisionase family DNA binding protein
MPRKRKIERGDLLTVSEVADEKGVTRTAVLYAIQDGRLEALRVGRNWVVPRTALDGYEPRAYSRRPTKSRRIPREPAELSAG